MNTRMIGFLLGRILMVEAGLLALPLLTALLYGEPLMPWLATMLVLAAIGWGLSLRKPERTALYAKDGFAAVALVWLLMSAFGALPFVLSGDIPNYIDAFFETVSGFTTTGASILTAVEPLSRGGLLWRSFTHWVGGMGVLVFVLMVIPMENDNSMHLVRAEVPGPTAGKLVPRMRTTSMILYGIYAVMTLILVVILKCLGMKVFDAFCIGFGTAGTGGFALNSAGIAGYGSPAIEIVLGIFMILFGINFNTYFLLLLRKFKEALTSEETAVYFGVIGVSVVAISINILSCFSNTGEAVRSAFFQVASIITTTGFATVDFNLWPEFSKHLIVLLMIIGACAGSTGGGLKISRVIILFKSFIAEIKQILNPKEVVSIRLNGKNVDKKTLNSTRIYFGAYVILICIFTLIISLDGLDLTTNLTAVLSCFNNIGPGLNLVGPMENFGLYSDWVKVVLSLAMLTGRLEIFPMFLLFAKSAHDR